MSRGSRLGPAVLLASWRVRPPDRAVISGASTAGSSYTHAEAVCAYDSVTTGQF